MAYVNFNSAFNDLVHLSNFAQENLGSDQNSNPIDPRINMPADSQSSQESKGSQSRDSFFERLVVSLPGMAFRCLFDENFTMTYVSPGCFQLTGVQPEELINNRTLAYANLIHPEDRRAITE